jgi:hypothetical protein
MLSGMKGGCVDGVVRGREATSTLKCGGGDNGHVM